MNFNDAVKHAGDVAAAVSYMHNDAMPGKVSKCMQHAAALTCNSRLLCCHVALYFDCTGAIVMHRDLKSSNIAFAHDGKLKLFDFGLAKVLRERDRSKEYTDKYKLTGNTGSLRYTSAEVS